MKPLRRGGIHRMDLLRREPQMLGFQQPPFSAKNDGAFDDVLQFADVAGPVMRFNTAMQSSEMPLTRTPCLRAKRCMNLWARKRHVLLAFAQGRHVNGHDVEAEKQVLAEFLAFDAFFQVPVGGGDDADVHLDGAVAADAFQFALLQDAQQLGLDLRGNLADFVQQDGAAVGQFEPAFALGQRRR